MPVLRLFLTCLLGLLLLGGCTAPAPNSATPPVETTAPAAAPAPVIAPTPVPSPVADGPAVQLDRSCSTDAECTVKDIGNCCGHYPACVNVDSPTDPEGVKAQCAKSGMASVCGFPAITSCQCVAGECKGSSKALLQ